MKVWTLQTRFRSVGLSSDQLFPRLVLMNKLYCTVKSIWCKFANRNIKLSIRIHPNHSDETPTVINIQLFKFLTLPSPLFTAVPCKSISVLSFGPDRRFRPIINLTALWKRLVLRLAYEITKGFGTRIKDLFRLTERFEEIKSRSHRSPASGKCKRLPDSGISMFICLPILLKWDFRIAAVFFDSW